MIYTIELPKTNTINRLIAIIYLLGWWDHKYGTTVRLHRRSPLYIVFSVSFFTLLVWGACVAEDSEENIFEIVAGIFSSNDSIDLHFLETDEILIKLIRLDNMKNVFIPLVTSD